MLCLLLDEAPCSVFVVWLECGLSRGHFLKRIITPDTLHFSPDALIGSHPTSHPDYVLQENQKLREQNDELNGQILSLSLYEAKNLFATQTKAQSLAAEIDNASRDQVKVTCSS